MSKGKIALAMVAVLALAACSANEKPAPGTSGKAVPSASSSSSASSAASAAPAGAPTALKVLAAEPAAGTYSFDTAGVQSVPAGLLAITLTNSGTVGHHANIVKIRDGNFDAYKTAVVAQGAAGGAPLGENVGGPNGVDPGGSTTTTSVVSPGTYALVCFIPGAPDGKAHAQHGMITRLEVTPPASEPALPPASGDIALQDFGFKVPDGFTGNGTFSVTNNGKQAHELAIFKLADGKTQDDLVTYFNAPPSGPPPGSGAGGVAGIDANLVQNVDLTLTKGNYVFICFLPDVTSDFQEHYKHGMVTTVTIT